MSVRVLGAVLLLSLSTLAVRAAPPATQLPAGWRIEQGGPVPVLIPEDLKPGETLTFAVLPAQDDPTKDLETTLRAAMQKDEANVGRLEREGTITHRGPVVATARTLTDAQGRLVTCAYFAFPGQDGKPRVTRVLAAPNPGIFQRYVEKITALNVLTRAGTLSLAGTPPPAAVPPKVAATGVPKKPELPTAQPRSPAPARATSPPAAGEKRLDPARIEGVYFVPTYGFGVGGFMTSSFEPYLLLKDGTLSKNFTIAPEYLDVERSRRESPKDWGRWERRGNTIAVTWNQGKPSTWETWYVGIPAKDGETLSGKYVNISGGGNVAFGGGVMIMAAKSMRFGQDGRFTLERKVSAASEEAGPFGTRTSSSAASGTYRLNGYTLTLTYGDGRVERRPFLFYSKKNQVKDPEAIFIGDDSYALRR